jgi:hydrogenase maturation protease
VIAQAPLGTVRVLVCGNPDRGDDGAAMRATRALPRALRIGDARLIELRTIGMLDVQHLLDSAGTPIVLVDTCAGIAPGRLVEIPFDDLVRLPDSPAPHSSHALPIDQVIGVARALSDTTVDGLFVGVGGMSFGFGRSLSSPVRSALPRFAAAIAAAVRRVAATPRGVEA